MGSGGILVGTSNEVAGVEESFGAVQGAVELLEPVPGGVLRSEVPFSGDKASISRWLEMFRDGCRSRSEPAAVAGMSQVVGGHVPQSDAMGVMAGEKACPGRATTTCVIELSQTDPAP